MLSNTDEMVALLVAGDCPLPAVQSADTSMLAELLAVPVPAPAPAPVPGPCARNGIGLDPRSAEPIESAMDTGRAPNLPGDGSSKDDSPVPFFAAVSSAPMPIPIFPVSCGLVVLLRVLFICPAPDTRKLLSDAFRCLGCSTSTGPSMLGISKSSNCPTEV